MVVNSIGVRYAQIVIRKNPERVVFNINESDILWKSNYEHY
jgi:hypothetical protein